MEIINVIEIRCGTFKKAEEHFESILKLMSVPEDEIDVALSDGLYYNNEYEYEIHLTYSYIED